MTVNLIKARKLSWTLTPMEFALTVEKVAKINARATKRGFTGTYELVGVPFERSYKHALTGMTVTESLVKATLAGDPPSYGGARFLAKVEWNQGLPIIQTAPGVEVDGGVDRAVLVDGFCSHCGTNRARKNTMIIEDKDGNQVQIGSSCIKDYLGWDTSPVFISTATVEDEVGGFSRGLSEPRSFTPLTILTHGWAAIRTFGWQPASQGGGTRDIVGYAIGAYDIPQHKNHMDWRNPCPACGIEEDLAKMAPMVDEATEEANRVLAYILSPAFSGNSEYVENLKTVAAASEVSAKFLGLMVSAPQAYAKHLNETLIRKERDETPSNWVGEIKQRLVFDALTIENINYIEGEYGTTVLYTLRQASTGNIFKWFASSEALGGERGVTMTLKGTIKKHEEFKGTKATVLSRCAEVAV